MRDVYVASMMPWQGNTIGSWKWITENCEKFTNELPDWLIDRINKHEANYVINNVEYYDVFANSSGYMLAAEKEGAEEGGYVSVS